MERTAITVAQAQVAEVAQTAQSCTGAAEPAGAGWDHTAIRAAQAKTAEPAKADKGGKGVRTSLDEAKRLEAVHRLVSPQLALWSAQRRHARGTRQARRKRE